MSIAGLLIAGVIPALILASLFCVYIVARCLANPKLAPPYPLPDLTLWERWRPFLIYVVPLSGLFAVVIGSLLSGVATPSESAALGCVAAVVAAAAYRSLHWRGLVDAFAGTVKISIMILFIIAASQTFSQILAFSGATGGLIRLIGQFELTPLQILLGMILILLFLGCFIDQVSMLMVTVPIFVPLADAVGIESLVLGVVYLLTMEIGLLTPPFGLLLFVMRGVAPAEIQMRQIYAAVAPFLVIKLFVLGLVVLVPGLGTWLPSLMGR
jgi:tripartite ATP-independent transporter DctM subunit